MTSGIPKGKTRQTPEERKAKAKEFASRPEYIAKRLEYASIPENIEKAKARKQSPEYKANAKKYRDTPENWAKAKARKQSPEYKAKEEKRRFKERLKVLKHYSKSLSNSDIPCCNCCGLNSHIGFLAIDHIAGRKEMDSELELKKIKYTSKLEGVTLNKWIIDNNFPDSFQVLCHNCNFSKGKRKSNNECPMKGKPH